MSVGASPEAEYQELLMRLVGHVSALYNASVLASRADAGSAAISLPENGSMSIPLQGAAAERLAQALRLTSLDLVRATYDAAAELRQHVDRVELARLASDSATDD